MSRYKILIASAIIIVAIMILSAFAPMMTFAGNSTAAVSSQSGASSAPIVSNAATANWTYPTTTQNEPGYTNGTYTVAATNNVGYLNMFEASSLYTYLLLDEIYGAPANTMPNGSISPWLATSWSEQNYSTQGLTTFDPLTGLTTAYNYTYTVNIRPNVQWTDWNTSNAADTYTYSNFVSVANVTGVNHTHTYSWSPVTMKTYLVQSADFILSWEILQDGINLAGTYINVVNAIPTNNLTVVYYLSNQSATFVTAALLNPILPYHIWQPHDYSDIAGLWNYSPNATAKTGYNDWGLGYNGKTGYAPGLIGSGPFEMNGNGVPKGYEIQSQGWQLYVNPHYWTQYASASSGFRQYTPKIYSVYFEFFTSLSNAVTAELKGQVDTITEGVTPNFVPTVLSMPNTYIYHKPASGSGFMYFNPTEQYAPLNITAFRQALNYAVNKAFLVSVVASGYGELGQSMIPPSDPLWRNATTPMYSYNPSKAISMISAIPGMVNKSGQWYYNGKPVTMNIQTTSAASNPLGVEEMLLIAKWWTEVGVPTTVSQESFTTLVPNLDNGNYQCVALGVTGVAGDPTTFYLVLYNSIYGPGTGWYQGPFSSLTYNGKFYTGDQIQSLLNNLTERLNAITNLSERIKISAEIQGIAAEESCMINLAYHVDILPFTNTTFTNISTANTLPYAGYMYWAFMTVYQRATPLSTSSTSHLEVSLSSSVGTVYNGEYANVTVTVKDSSSGNTVSNANVYVGVNPAGALLNVSSDKGLTNSNGQYVWEFEVLSTQPMIYTSDYMGTLNISAAAYETPPTAVAAGIGSVLINVLPKTVKISTSDMPTLKSGGSPQLFTITVTNETGTPLSGFAYTVQSLSGAVILSNTSSDQTVTTGVSTLVSVNNTQNHNDGNITSITGKTGSNGTIAVLISANSSFNFAATNDQGYSYIFFGNMISGIPVGGLAGYMIPAEMTTPFSDSGFGSQQPIEFPVQLVKTSPNVNIKLTVNETDINYNGSISVTATVTNASSGKAISGYVVDLLAQNILGANRGYFVNSNGTDILAANPNNAFASQYLPGIRLTTDSNGKVTATFYPLMYTYDNASSPVFKQAAFASTTLIPADEFTIMAMGVNSTTGTPISYVLVNSAPSTVHVTHKAPSTMPSYIYYIIGAVIAVVVIVGVVIGLTRRGPKTGTPPKNDTPKN